MRGFTLIILVALVCSRTAHASGSQQLCRQVCQQVTDDVCGRQGDIQPMRGKAGPRGEKGDTGAPGTVDVDAVVSSVMGRVTPVIDALTEKVDAMESDLTGKDVTISDLQKKLQELRKRQDLCKVFYGGRCFWAVIGGSINQAQAQEICSNAMGAKPANVYSRLHYDMLMDYMRPLIGPSDHRDYVWIGMKYNVATRTVSYDNGTTAAFVKWHEGYPDRRAGFTEMCFLVMKDASSASQGFYNQPVQTTKKGVLCEL